MKKVLLVIIGLCIVIVIALGIDQFYAVNKAHSTFDNYYAFRGCAKLISRASDSAVCQLPSGQTIKLVEYENKWYLDGDLPCMGPKLSVGYFLCVI